MCILKTIMNLLSNSFFKNLISILAITNIIVMLVFQYGLPSHYPLSEDNGVVQHETNEETNVGTIESVEQETEAKESEAIENALAREDVEEQEEPEVEEERDPDAPILELTDDHIFLRVGDRFNYMSYIKTMQDVDGSDLSHYIYLDRDVDTSEPGEIELTYRITSTITGKSDSKVLLITIRE